MSQLADPRYLNLDWPAEWLWAGFLQRIYIPWALLLRIRHVRQSRWLRSNSKHWVNGKLNRHVPNIPSTSPPSVVTLAYVSGQNSISTPRTQLKWIHQRNYQRRPWLMELGLGTHRSVYDEDWNQQSWCDPHCRFRSHNDRHWTFIGQWWMAIDKNDDIRLLFSCSSFFCPCTINVWLVPLWLDVTYALASLGSRGRTANTICCAQLEPNLILEGNLILDSCVKRLRRYIRKWISTF